MQRCVFEGGGGGASFLENSTRKQRQERGRRSRKLHPLSTRNTVAMATRRGVQRTLGELVFVVPTPSGVDGSKHTEAAMCLAAKVVRFSIRKPHQ